MATYTKFEDFAEQVLTAVHNFTAAGHVFKAYLTNTAPSASGDAVKADLAESMSTGGGYTVGGEDIQNTLSESGGTATVAATDVVWTGSGGGFGPFRYVPIYNDTAASDNLLCYYDYASSISVAAAETFTLDFGASLFTLA